MSQENVEIVRRLWEAWERRDTEAVLGLYDPAIVWEVRASPLSGSYVGHEGVRQYFREWMEAFEGYDAKAETFIDAGDKVVVRSRVRGRGKASGVEVGMPGWQVYRIRDGLVIRVDFFQTEAEALEAAGLSEQDAHADP
jgi:ketosteroid isomerase-like protein